MNRSAVLVALFVAPASVACGQVDSPPPSTVKVATYNIEDVRTVDLLRSDHPRLEKIAAAIRQIDPDIILLNEIQYDQKGDPWATGDSSGLNARRFIEHYLTDANGTGAGYQALMLPSNTGIASGFDLDNDGDTVWTVPPLPDTTFDRTPASQSSEGRAYGNDAYGFGTFPGQYGMALLVKRPLTIVEDSVRTFRMFLWKDLPEALMPSKPDTNEPWYSEPEWSALRLSSKSHWDVPIDVGHDEFLHILASHPTPPAFDGPEKRNQYRNRDEIRFWNEYLSGGSFIVDDQGRRGGLASDAPFIIIGDLNADIDEGSSFENPVQKYLFDHPRVNGGFVPLADKEIQNLDRDDTAWWGLRVDYVLPSAGLEVIDGAVYRPTTVREDAATDHFPVWVEVEIP